MNLVSQDKQNIFNLVKWGLILIIIILLLKECGSVVNTLIKTNKPLPDTTIIHKIDTIWAKDTIYSFKKIKVPVPYIEIQYLDTSNKEICTNVKVYEDSLVDKNISIYYKDYVSQGELLTKELSYRLKVPLTITNSSTTTINVPTLYPPTFQLHGGLTVGSNIFSPQVSVSYKRHTLTLGYNMTTKQPIIGYGFVLFRK